MIAPTTPPHRLTRDEERSLFEKLRRLEQRRGRRSAEQARAIRDRIVADNRGLVGAVAGRLTRPDLPHDELMAEGMLPLLRAVALFDPSRGYRFSTYATCAVRNHLVRQTRRHQRRLELVVPADPVLIDRHAAGRSEEPGSDEAAVAVATRVTRLLATLDSRARRLVGARFGLDGCGGPRSFARIGREVGLSRERVRQIVRGSLEQLAGHSGILAASAR